MRYWARVWGLALVRSAAQLSPLWGSMLLDRFGYHTAALVLMLGFAVILAVLVVKDFLRFRRAYLRRRRRGW